MVLGNPDRYEMKQILLINFTFSIKIVQRNAANS